jgi:hypothetical protein
MKAACVTIPVVDRSTPVHEIHPEIFSRIDFDIRKEGRVKRMQRPILSEHRSGEELHSVLLCRK